MVPAVSSAPDVGGTRGEQVGVGTVHGSRNSDTSYDLDGMAVGGSYNTGGTNILTFFSQSSIQEMTGEITGMSAEVSYGGLRFNVIPKEELESWVKLGQPVADAWIADVSAKGVNGKQLYDGAKALIAKHSAGK